MTQRGNGVASTKISARPKQRGKDGEKTGRFLFLFRGRNNGYQIFVAFLARNASLDKLESLFTVAGYSFVVFPLETILRGTPSFLNLCGIGCAAIKARKNLDLNDITKQRKRSSFETVFHLSRCDFRDIAVKR